MTFSDDPEYELEISKLEGYRTMLGVPLLREGTPVWGDGACPLGSVGLSRRQQIELVEHFCRPGRHRHREHAVAQRAARSRFNSRPQPPTCSRSSAVHPANLSQSLRPCWRTPCACVRRNSVLCIDAVAITGKSRLNMARYQPTPTSCDAQQGQDLKPLLDASRVPGRWFRSPTSQRHEVMPNAIH